MVEQYSALAFNNLVSDLDSYLHINREQCKAYSSSLSALLCSAVVSVGPLQL